MKSLMSVIGLLGILVMVTACDSQEASPAIASGANPVASPSGSISATPTPTASPPTPTPTPSPTATPAPTPDFTVLRADWVPSGTYGEISYCIVPFAQGDGNTVGGVYHNAAFSNPGSGFNQGPNGVTVDQLIIFTMTGERGYQPNNANNTELSFDMGYFNSSNVTPSSPQSALYISDLFVIRVLHDGTWQYARMGHITPCENDANNPSQMYTPTINHTGYTDAQIRTYVSTNFGLN